MEGPPGRIFWLLQEKEVGARRAFLAVSTPLSSLDG